eukprot:1150529-Pelagomonas_calceolata.AAC.6
MCHLSRHVVDKLANFHIYWYGTESISASTARLFLDTLSSCLGNEELPSTHSITTFQVVAMERKNEKGLFAALDAKLKAQQLRFKVGYMLKIPLLVSQAHANTESQVNCAMILGHRDAVKCAEITHWQP